MNPLKSIKQIRLIYFVIVALLSMFAIFSIYFVMTFGQFYETDGTSINNLKALSIILALAGIPASYMFHKRKVAHIDLSLPTHKKLLQYRNSFFIKIITLEGVSLISLLIYLITVHINQLIIFGLIFLFLLLNYPKKKVILNELEIDESELNR